MLTQKKVITTYAVFGMCSCIEALTICIWGYNPKNVLTFYNPQETAKNGLTLHLTNATLFFTTRGLTPAHI